MRRPLELLSPARDTSIAREAILAGADAVYIGADRFGARKQAANSADEIAKLCDFAHIYGARVYAAINTILTDSELLEAEKLVWRLYRAGIDAVILQDLGLLKCDLPPLILHASTQCHIDTPEKAKMLEACGFETLVLARELSLSEISSISGSVSAAIECFVHGALCVSYSGQCYLSHAVGGRSANRGECAQPCRMPYALLDADNREIMPQAHYLCLRDMNRLKRLSDMIDAGVSSFKIEGRLKDASYVKNITALYRKALDEEIAKRNLSRSSYGESYVQFKPDERKSFNRGYTEFYLDAPKAGAANFISPKSRGEEIGTVKQTFPGGFIFENAEKTFSNSDGLFFEVENNPLKSFGAQVRNAQANKVFVGRPQDCPKIPLGAKIFRNRDCAFEKEISLPCSRKVPVKLRFYEDGGKYVLSAKTADERGICAQVSTVCAGFEPARDAQRAAQKLSNSFSKLGSTAFECADIEISATPHMPASSANDMRRRLAEALEAASIKAHLQHKEKRGHFSPRKSDLSVPPFDTDWRANCMNAKAQQLYRDIGFQITQRAPEFSKDSMLGKKVMRTKYCLLRELGMCIKNGPKKPPKLPLKLKSEQSLLRLDFDCTRCGMDVVLLSRKAARHE